MNLFLLYQNGSYWTKYVLYLTFVKLLYLSFEVFTVCKFVFETVLLIVDKFKFILLLLLFGLMFESVFNTKEFFSVGFWLIGLVGFIGLLLLVGDNIFYFELFVSKSNILFLYVLFL